MSRRLTIGLVAPPLPENRHDATASAIDSLARGLHEEDHTVELLTMADLRADRQGRCQAALIAHRLHEAVGDGGELGRCHIVHDHTLGALFLRNLHHRLPVVTTNHGPFSGDPVDRYRRHPDAHVPLVAASADHASRAPDSVTVSAVLPHAVDLARYRYRARTGNYLLASGTLAPGSGIPAAIAVARAAGLPINVEARLVDPDEHEYYQREVEPHLGPDVEFIGNAPFLDWVDLLAGASAFLHLPDRAEPFPYSVVEAMACGTPVVATDHGPATEVVDHEQTGFIVGSRQRAIAAIERLGSISRARCREHADRNYGHRRVAKRHIDLYLDILDRRRAQAAAERAWSVGHPAVSQDPRPHRYPVVS